MPAGKVRRVRACWNTVSRLAAPAAGAEDAARDLAADDGARRAHCALERRALHHLLEHSWLGAPPRLHLTLGAGFACVDGHWRRQRSVRCRGCDLRLQDLVCRLLLEKKKVFPLQRTAIRGGG